METVRSALEILKILSSDSKLVIFGGGNYGKQLSSELNDCGYYDYQVCDNNNEIGNYINNFISLKELLILAEHFCVCVVIAVKNEDIIKQIIDSITVLCLRQNSINRFHFCRFIPISCEELVKRRKEKGFYNGSIYKRVFDNDKAVQSLMTMITEAKPFLFARWGSECDFVYRTRTGVRLTLNESIYLKNNLGVFPISEDLLTSYFNVMERSAKEIDMLCAFYWQKPLDKLIEWYSPDVAIVSSDLEYPFFSNPWTKALKGLKVLVIHPFVKLFVEQYKRRDKLFRNSEVLPEFDLLTYKAVQSLGGNDNFKDWIEALNFMQDEISKKDFDIALIGCGAYGMPLGAFIKSEMHKKAIHMGGSLQLLFGIKGKRWEESSYNYQYKLYNKYWIRPTDDLKPQNYMDVENGCYW